MSDEFKGITIAKPAGIQRVLVRVLSLELKAAFMALKAAETDAIQTASMALDDVRRVSELLTEPRTIERFEARAEALKVAIARSLH